jgi:hypothetical protein
MQLYRKRNLVSMQNKLLSLSDTLSQKLSELVSTWKKNPQMKGNCSHERLGNYLWF